MSTTMKHLITLWIAGFVVLLAGCGGEELTLARKAIPDDQGLIRHRSDFPLDSAHMSRGQLLYAPVYSELLFFEEKMQKLTAANLSIRNVSPEHPLRILFVDYYDDHGTLLRNYLHDPIELEALGSTTFIIEQGDRSAGAGANFLVAWQADSLINNPIVETVTVQYMGPRGLAFRSPSRVVRELR